MNSIKTKRGHLKGCLTRATSFAESIDERVPLELIETRLQNLNETWLKFSELTEKLLEFSEENDFVDPSEDFAEYETKFFLTQSTFKKVIRERCSEKTVIDNVIVKSAVDKLADQQAVFLQHLNNSKSSCSVSLPKLNIPLFSGNYKEWPSFRDHFLGSIDCNKDLSATQKFHYLKSLLREEAADLIRHITISDVNFLDAWERLEKRYDRPNFIIQSHIHSFLSMQSITTFSVQALRKITLCADETIRGLNSLGSNKRDPWVIYLLLQKLDPDTKQSWAEEVGSKEDCSIEDLITFLNARCDALESCQSISRPCISRVKTAKSLQSHFVESNISCPKCKLNHTLNKCEEFISLDINTRRAFVKDNSLCFNCLRAGHTSKKCRSIYTCKAKDCKSRHHTLVHTSNTTSNFANTDAIPSTSNAQRISSDISNNKNQSVSLCSSIQKSNSLRFSQTFLPTAIAQTLDKQKIKHNIRVLLDTGSQVSFVTEQTVQSLGLVRKHARIPIVGVGSTPAGVTNGVVTLKLISRFNQNFVEVDCYIVPKLTSLIPSSLSNIPDHYNFTTYELADPNFNVPGHIDVLIGADKAFTIINGSTIRSHQGLPNLISTIFGWVVCGNHNISNSVKRGSVNSYCTQLDISQPFDLERFWRLEEVQVEQSLSLDDQHAEDIFVQTHSRLFDGRYIGQLPFKSNETIEFGNSFLMALKRFNAIERKMEINPYLKEKYVSFMNEYLHLEHMEEVPQNEIDMPSNKCFYLPHHAVFKEDSSTTKVRVVFDASAKSSNGKSLNETLLVGQSYQRDIFSICIRFRRHLFTISGDIEKMFRQIKVVKEHTDFQRILWRESTDCPVKHYRLLTVTYGTACATFLAVRTLFQLALDSKETHPRAAEVLLNDFYVDDVMTGADTIEEVTSLQLELVSLLKSAGLNLRKWTTYCWPLLLSLPEEQREMSPKEFEEYNCVKLLGLQWSPAKDTFSYKVNLGKNISLTKRSILSESSRIFDPLGFLTPVVISIKILFQELWRKKYNWDDVLSKNISEKWLTIREDLPNLETLVVSRIMWTSKENVEFHAFCDASLDAYAAVVYCKSTDLCGNVSSTIVAAKSRVAPIKVLSLPRLELCGAVLLTRLVNKLKTSLQRKEMKVYAWTDSAIVLHWLSALPKKWSVFIGNRTSEIINTLPRECWNHVRSSENPADCASRGILPSHLKDNELWRNGPAWIKEDPSQWPNIDLVDKVPIEHLEERKNGSVKALTTKIELNNLYKRLIENASSFSKVIRVLAFIRRFISNARVKPDLRKRNSLSSMELFDSRDKLIKFHQSAFFLAEINILSKGEVLERGNKLAALAPFLDKKGLLRVGGRIEESNATFSTKHPLIIDKNTKLARLIVEKIHKCHLHAGASLMFAILRQEYFMIGCRNLLRKIVHECLNCFRYRKETTEQIMGNLPAERVRYSRPFSKVGVDFAGPIILRLARGRNPKFVKGYIALFVCFATKAVHIELVSDLSTTAFLAALDRFSSRRGKPMEIWSDNATNFHGAKKTLDEMFKVLMSQQHNNIVIDHLSKDKIAWKFIPPSAPHFGGLWEAGIKSVKFHLKRVIKDHRLTYEEMYTLLTQIEALLNSRPMWPTSDSDPVALTPAHFLIGEPLFSVPHPDTFHLKTFTNWSLLQNLKQGFWKRWHAEYLTSLQQRPKWQNERPELKVGDVVMLKDSSLPPAKWVLARVKEVHPGKDKRTRVATVITQTGEYTRPIVKLAALPFAERTESFRGG